MCWGWSNLHSRMRDTWSLLNSHFIWRWLKWLEWDLISIPGSSTLNNITQSGWQDSSALGKPIFPCSVYGSCRFISYLSPRISCSGVFQTLIFHASDLANIQHLSSRFSSDIGNFFHYSINPRKGCMSLQLSDYSRHAYLHSFCQIIIILTSGFILFVCLFVWWHWEL